MIDDRRKDVKCHLHNLKQHSSVRGASCFGGFPLISGQVFLDDASPDPNVPFSSRPSLAVQMLTPLVAGALTEVQPQAPVRSDCNSVVIYVLECIGALINPDNFKVQTGHQGQIVRFSVRLEQTSRACWTFASQQR